MARATKESFAKAVEALLRKYEADRETYISSEYNETQARSQFITPFFKALGWDVENEAGVPYHLCDVWEEKGETHGRPDYTFRINGQTKFFIEAKAPSPDVSTVSHILQTKRYAWNSRDVFFAGLFDFEELLFFDASLEPDERRVRDGEAFHLIFKEYLDNIDRLWELSKERVAAGSLEQFLRRDRKSIRYRIPVDKKFLDELTEWRRELASNIYSKNEGLDAHKLNDIVQRLLDRIVFIRIAEDRKVIESRQLWDIADLWEESGGRRNIMEFMVDLFTAINADFNGEIFKPHPCEQVHIDSSILAKIIRRLYPPKSPYRFDVIGVELLGSIYERFLGNTLHIIAKQVRLEPKPEVRKAGGVYYTPKFIVDYIVEHALGTMLEGKTPREVEKLRVLDPACGSGSFLIGAFQHLIDWHLNYYREHKKQARVHPMYPEVMKDSNGNLRLSFHAKARIMRQNLYGVDIDPQAVEVTMMSLYLKALEGEQEMLAPKQSILPELKFNIRCGNSLIAGDIEKDHVLNESQRQSLRPFEWHSKDEGFGDILAAGGFDVVVGNPPYGADYDEIQKAYFQSHYAYKKGKPETYIYFLERAISLLRPGGNLGFITPNAWLTNHYGAQIRRHILASGCLEDLVDLEPTKVFEGAVVDTAITVVKKGNNHRTRSATRVWQGTKDRTILPRFTVDHRVWLENSDAVINLQADPNERILLGIIEEQGAPLDSIVEYSQGVIPYKTKADGQANRYIDQKKRGKEWLPLIESAAQVRRFEMDKPAAFIRYGPWLWCARKQRFFSEPKILFHRLRKKLAVQLVGAFDDTGLINRHSLSNLVLRPGISKDSILAVLGLFNSRLANWWFVKTYGVLMEVGGFKVARMPLPRKWHIGQEELMKIVTSMCELHRGLAAAGSDSEKVRIQNQIGDTDTRLDQLVYELYGLSKQHVSTIEAVNPRTQESR